MTSMYVFAGCNGAGKSTLIEAYGNDFDTIINPDMIAKQLNPNDPRKADLSAGKQAIKEIQSCFLSRNTFAVETTLSGQFIIKQMQYAKSIGYNVHFYYIGLQDVQMHIDRVRARVMQGGHYISEEDILRRYNVSLRNVKKALAISDIAVILDNSKDKFEKLIEIIDGKVIYKAKWLPQWLVTILES